MKNILYSATTMYSSRPAAEECKNAAVGRVWRMRFPSIFNRIILLTVLVFTALLGASDYLAAQEMPIRVETQAEIFRRIFLFNKSFEGKKKLKVVVVYSSVSADTKDGIVAAFQAQGMSAVAVPEAALEQNIDDVQAVYISQGVLTAEKICAQFRILSITGIPTLARNGKASIALGTKNGKASIIVHRQQLKNESQQMSAELLQMAQVIQ